jgi:P-type Ca2+ transporter type 2C
LVSILRGHRYTISMSDLSKKPEYQLTAEETLKRYVSTPTGLAGKEALARFDRDGPNALVALKTDSWLRKYLRQYQDWMILLLVASGGIAAYLGDMRTAIVLGALVLFNTAIGFFQEYRAEKTMQALEKLVQPMAEVYRDGKLTELESRDLVVGDVVRMSEGDSVPADVRLIDLTTFSTNDFALTGESSPAHKFLHAIGGVVPVANRHNLAFMGTTVAIGEAYGVVIATGMNTELGRIANLSQSAPHGESPLQRELRHIATYVTYAVAILSLALLFVAMQIDLPFKDALLFAVGFASSLVPQGLPAEVNTSLAQAAGKLSRARALVKKLSAVETLGSTQIICTDKTGTLTKNEMTVVSAVVGGVEYTVEGTGYEPKGRVLRDDRDVTSEKNIQDFFKIGLYASNAKVVAPDSTSSKWYCLGDPTEGALVTVAAKVGLSPDDVSAKAHEIRELPFDSSRKRMTSLRQFSTGRVTAFVKGAPEAILERATHIQDGAIVRPITDTDREVFLVRHTQRAEQALRNLAFATRVLPEKVALSGSIDEIESGLTLVGIVSMIDPLREAVPAAMRAAHQAHIKVNVVTGDFATTAEAIARQAGLAPAGQELVVISGEELAVMPDDEVLRHTRTGGTIFSRVSPEDKMRIVGLAKSSGHVIAVTGDGINDAPALKRADIGVAMGITGTDVAKQSSEVILLDDSFSTLVRAIREGRTIFANIKKGVLSCFTSNTAELVVNLSSLLLASLIGAPLAINVLQILAIDLLAELFPIAALGWDKEEGETMKQPPRDPRSHILNRRSIIDLLWCGLVIGGLAIVNYLLFYQRHGVSPDGASEQLIYQATTLTYTTIVICQLVNIIQRRSIHGFFSRYQFSNRYFWGAIALSLSIVLSIAYVPVVSTFFKSGPISSIDWIYVIAAAAIFLFVREIQRIITNKKKAV